MRELYKWMLLFGIDGKKLYQTLIGFPRFISDINNFRTLRYGEDTFRYSKWYPILNDWNDEAGNANGHYFHQDLYVAQKVFKNNPHKHVDIGSRIDGFVAHVASFREIEIIDIRELNSNTENMIFRKADLMVLPEDLIEYTDSISCLHALEHFGLGRYGDPLDYFGYLKGLTSISKILKTGGRFYFSVPIGEQRIEFNAHRVFSVSYLIKILSTDYKIESFSYVNDEGNFIKNPSVDPESAENSFSCKYGCGIFELVKL